MLNSSEPRRRKKDPDRERERSSPKRDKDRDREKDKEREQAEIEKGWDLPTQAQVQAPYQAAATGPVAEVARPKAQKEGKGTAMNGAAVNGIAAIHPAHNSAVNGVAAKEAILEALLTKAPAPASIGRNDFVRELLALIHVSTSFSSSPINVC